MDRQATAKRLLKLADVLQKRAEYSAYFVCDTCNHTANLSSINSKRERLASEEGNSDILPRVSVNDRVSCPACEGSMSYVATEESGRYIYDESKTAGKDDEEILDDLMEDEGEDKEEKKSPKKGEKSEEPEESEESEEEPKDTDEGKEKSKDEDVGDEIDIDKLFEDVETQKKKDEDEGEKEEEDTSSAMPPDEIEEKEVTEEPKEPKGPEKTEESEEISEEIIEEPKKEEKPKKKKKTKDKPDDGKANLDKDEVPQFKSKEAGERFKTSFDRYMQ